MTFGPSTFSNLGGAASDLLAGFGASEKGALQAQGLRITAAGTRIGAQSTRLSADGLRIKAQGDLAEASNYDIASTLAQQNEAFTAQSTRVQQMQLDRQVTQAIGGQQASVAGAGFASSGSALDIMRDSASQGALAHGVLGQQGAITEAGFEEQATSFQTMAAAGRATAAGEMDIAGKTDVIAGQQDAIATQQDQLAAQTQQAANNQASGDFVSSLIKGAAAVGSLLTAPVTGGASLAVGAAAASAMSGTGGLY
jgi:murein L,D-transpeptidase YcbB/YkuD